MLFWIPAVIGAMLVWIPVVTGTLSGNSVDIAVTAMASAGFLLLGMLLSAVKRRASRGR